MQELAAKTEWAILSTRLPLSVLGKVAFVASKKTVTIHRTFHHTTSDVLATVETENREKLSVHLLLTMKQ
jgi:hypothetical protein